MSEDPRAARRGPGADDRRPPEPSVAFFLINVGRRTRERVEAQLAEHGLSFRHVAALGHLQREPGLSYSELARRSGVTAQSMQSTIAQLTAADLVELGPGAGQGRRADLALTDGGREALARAEHVIRLVDDDLVRGLSPAERVSLEAILLRMFLTPTDPVDITVT